VQNGEADVDWRCVALCAGDLESDGAVVFVGMDGVGVQRLLVVVSQDRTVKVWDLGFGCINEVSFKMTLIF
jgi:hypothetical protein